MSSKRVLVVGGSGFIGTRLLAAHPDWSNIDLKWDRDFCEIHPQDFKAFDVVVLLAASLGMTQVDYSLNLDIYATLARCMSIPEPTPHLVYTSSAAVYGPFRTVASEWNNPEPWTLYGKSKYRGEQIVEDVCDSYTILRLSNVYGDGEGSGVIDNFKCGVTTVYGDGEQVRDYIYVDQVVEAIGRVVRSPGKYDRRTFNISSGEGRTVNEVFKQYGRGEPVYKPGRIWDVMYSVLDNTKAKKAGLL